MTGDYGALPSTARQRLDRFADAFDQVDPVEYEMFASNGGPRDVVEQAEDDAWSSVSGSRRSAVEDAVRAFQGRIAANYASRMPIPYVPIAVLSFSSRVEDRARVIETMRRAILAVALWDELAADDRDVLLGGWARLAVRAGLEG